MQRAIVRRAPATADFADDDDDDDGAIVPMIIISGADSCRGASRCDVAELC